MRSLVNDIMDCCEGRMNYSYYYHSHDAISSSLLNMVIPTSESVFEIPTLALFKWKNTLETYFPVNAFDAIVVKLKDSGKYPRYKTLDSVIKDALATSYEDTSLIKIKVNNLDATYYITNGAIFSEDFTPIMMLSWLVQKEQTLDSGINLKYRFLRPVLRIDPGIFITKGNSMERYICNKITLETLNTGYIKRPYPTATSLFGNEDINTKYHIKIEIDKCPFVLKKIDAPSVSTTNRDILDIALNHLDEITQ